MNLHRTGREVLLALMLSLFAMTLQAEEMKYFVNVHDRFKGVLLIDGKRSGYVAKYYNISPHDKIPFYAPKKIFALTTLEGYPTLSSIEVPPMKKEIVYDLTKLSRDDLDDAGVDEEDLKESAIIYNDEHLSEHTTQKLPIHTIESLTTSIFKTKRVPDEPFYLFEPHKKMLIKVEFHKGKNRNVQVDGKSCMATEWILKVYKRNKRLVRVLLTPYPVVVEAFSKKWSFALKGVGEPKNIVLDKKKLAFEAFETELRKQYANYTLKIVSQKIKKEASQTLFETKFRLETGVTPDEIESSIGAYLQGRSNLPSKFSHDAKSAFKIAVGDDDVNEYLKEKYDIEDEKHYWNRHVYEIDKRALLQQIADEKEECNVEESIEGTLQLICDGDAEKVDYKEALEEYLEKKYKERDYKFDGIDEETGRWIRYGVKLLEPVTNDMKIEAVKSLMAKKTDAKLPESLKIYHSGGKYVVYISKKDVGNYVCEKKMPSGLAVRYEKGVCIADGIKRNSEKEANDIVFAYIYEKYPDLKILGIHPKVTPTSISFKYLNDLSKVTNACK